MDLAALMRSPVITIAADVSLRQARALMARYGIRHLPVRVLTRRMTDAVVSYAPCPVLIVRE